LSIAGRILQPSRIVMQYMRTNPIKMNMIAPCGMNCAICLSQFRSPKTCDGCNNDSQNKPKYCSVCRIKNCEIRLKGNYKYCFQCNTFPCTRLKQLDKRYRTKYGMSMLENLRYIKENGIREFVRNEKARWTCPQCGEVLCVHRQDCTHCGLKRKIKRSNP
jgi:hypothetical protein